MEAYNNNNEEEKPAVAMMVKTRSVRPGMKKSASSRLSTKSMFYGIPTVDDTVDHTEIEHGTHSWRYCAVQWLHKPVVQKFMSCLLVADILLLFIELFLLATFPHCSLIERDAVSCVAANATTDEHRSLLVAAFRTLAEDAHHDSDAHHFCDAGYTAIDSPAGCDEHKWSAVHTLEKVIFGFTVAILSTFFLELTVEMIALTPQVFCRQFWFLLDYIIITISLLLEISFFIKQDEVYQSAAGILVLVRIWRFVRIGHGIVEITHETVTEGHGEVLDYVHELEGLLEQHQIALPATAKSFHDNNHDHTTKLLETIEETDSKRRMKECEEGEGDCEEQAKVAI